MPYIHVQTIIDIVDERFSHYWQRVYQIDANCEEEPRCPSLRSYAKQRVKDSYLLFSFLRACDLRETAILHGILHPEPKLEEECLKLLELAQSLENHDFRGEAKKYLENFLVNYHDLLDRNIDPTRIVHMTRRDKSADIQKDGYPFFVHKQTR